jgi:hypothetical protein
MAATMGKFSVQTDGSLNGGGMNLHNIADPISNQDAATKNWVNTKFTTYAPSGVRIKVSVLTSGTSFTTQANTTHIDVLAIGDGGGAGGGYQQVTGGWSGFGGNGARGWLLSQAVTGNTAYAISIGPGGSGGASGQPGANGTSGSGTSITIAGTTYTAGGGNGGSNMASNGTMTSGTGGVVSNFPLGSTGSTAIHAYYTTPFLPLDNPFNQYGQGGAGVTNGFGYGGNGATGALIIWEYA